LARSGLSAGISNQTMLAASLFSDLFISCLSLDVTLKIRRTSTRVQDINFNESQEFVGGHKVRPTAGSIIRGKRRRMAIGAANFRPVKAAQIIRRMSRNYSVQSRSRFKRNARSDFVSASSKALRNSCAAAARLFNRIS